MAFVDKDGRLHFCWVVADTESQAFEKAEKRNAVEYGFFTGTPKMNIVEMRLMSSL